jgi:hypothetical protein
MTTAGTAACLSALLTNTRAVILERSEGSSTGIIFSTILKFYHYKTLTAAALNLSGGCD